MSLRARLTKITAGVVALTMIGAFTLISAPLASAANTIVQGPDTSGTTDVAGSAAFTDTLSAASGADGGPVTFTPSSVTTPGLNVNNGNEIVTSGVLAAGNYSISGSDSDLSGDSGTWSYSLSVAADPIVQASPTSGSTDVAGSTTFSATLAAASGFVGPVTFTTSTSGFEITDGDVLSSTARLSATGSPYTVSGGDSDAYGDAGTWSYSLSVSSDSIGQGSPTSGTTSASNSASFSAILTATSGIAPVTFTTSTPGFTVTSGDKLETTGSLTVGGSPYDVTGTDSDAYGDSGVWAFTLSVTSSGTGGAPSTTLVQTSSTTASVSNTSSGTFTAGPITVDNNRGAVTFVTTKPSTDVAVSDTGMISTSGPLVVGTYNVSGTDSDPAGDTGTWTFTLSVTAAAVPETVTFHANGGTGDMAPETESAPTALTLNSFAWAKHTFVDWNTSANGSGVSYANGASFPFGAATNLFAQWKKGKVPLRTITFAANGGVGTTASETHNTPTAVSPSRFTRRGYRFLNWNSKADGSGRSYKAGATYSFTSSITLYAQWSKTKKPKPPAPKVHIVTFRANGGAGTMAPEDHSQSAALTTNHFTRAGFTFLHWNSNANGAGSSYANGATYSFGASITLYAQWKKEKVVVPPPPVPSGTHIGPFSAQSSTLSSALEAQIESVAVEAAAKKSTAISLIGYGDTLSAADANNPTFEAANITLSRQRAQAVATYLGGRLTALGLKGWTISIAAAPNGKSGSGQGASSIVIASLS